MCIDHESLDTLPAEEKQLPVRHLQELRSRCLFLLEVEGDVGEGLQRKISGSYALVDRPLQHAEITKCRQQPLNNAPKSAIVPDTCGLACADPLPQRSMHFGDAHLGHAPCPLRNEDFQDDIA